MIRDDRALLAELARLNTDVVPLAMRIMDESVTAEEQYTFAERLIAMAAQLQRRATTPWLVVDGEIDPGGYNARSLAGSGEQRVRAAPAHSAGAAGRDGRCRRAGR